MIKEKKTFTQKMICQCCGKHYKDKPEVKKSQHKCQFCIKHQDFENSTMKCALKTAQLI